jgi:hypothetical protein
MLRSSRVLLVLLIACFSGGLADAATVASVFNGRIPCVEEGGVQVCTGSLTTRVESWDGVPLDVNVTIPPASRTGPFPLIVDLHGWSLSKGGPFVARALNGFVVVSPTARGFHGSCGVAAARMPDASLSNPNVCAERGWTHLADARYEARDVQQLAGLLADEGLIIPDKVGVTGISYGGGQSFLLAALKDRVMLPNGTFTPWLSPAGLPMRIAAAAPLIGWTDLAYSLVPNGRTLDGRTDNPYGARVGVQKQSWNAALYGVGLGTGFYAPTGSDPSADLVGWNERIAVGEPYDGDSASGALIAEITNFHSAYYLEGGSGPAPIFAYNAWTDDLFPADEALRYWRRVRARFPGSEFALHFEDGFGHPRAALGGNVARVLGKVDRFFARHLQGSGDPLPPLEAFTQACGGSTETGPHAAADWDAIHPGEVRYVSRRVRRFTEAAGVAENATAADPLSGGAACRMVSATDDRRAATYRFPKLPNGGVTLLGSPTIIAELQVTNDAAQVAARLWDVGPDKTQALVAHAFYRPRADNRGPQMFQLHSNGWHFAAGHVIKLELLGQSAPYGRPSRLPFEVVLKQVELRLPVLEAPGAFVKVPAAVPPLVDAGEPVPCPSVPAASCRTGTTSGASELVLAGGSRGTLKWNWRSGDATTSDEVQTALDDRGFALCVYGAAKLLTSAAAVGRGACGRAPCWTTNDEGARSSKPGAAQSGLRVAIEWGEAGASRIAAASAPRRLVLPSLPIASAPITLQLRDAAGNCWGSVFRNASPNSAKRWVARSE